jgi:uncharacterized protein DUF4349
MRKRIVTVRLGTVAAAFTALLLAAAYGCTSDTGGSPGVGSGKRMSDSSGPSDAVAIGAAGAVGRDRPLAAQLAPSMAPRPEVATASATANEDHAFSLGSPLSTDLSGTMLIRNGQASVEVTRLNDAMTKVRQTAGQLGGFVANMSVVGGKEEHKSAQLELRVPSAQFDAAVIALGALGRVESMSANVQDVGDEYVDLGARATNARHMEARLAEMLAQRTGKLSEALTVEQELRRVREEIERYDARLKWLERKAAMSSIQITLHEPVSVLDQPGPGPIAEAFAQAWQRAVGVLAWGIASLGLLVPLGLLVTAMLLLARRLLRPGTPPGVSGA